MIVARINQLGHAFGVDRSPSWHRGQRNCEPVRKKSIAAIVAAPVRYATPAPPPAQY